MCLAVPHKITTLLENNMALAQAGPITREIQINLIDNPQPGDVVLVHAGFAIEKLDVCESQELEKLWDEIRELAGENGELPF